MVFILCYR